MKALSTLLALFAVPATAQTIAVTHAEAWTMEGPEPVKDATIVIENGKIVSVTPGGAVPPEAIVVDAQGKPVTPGLFNGATQVGLVETASADTRDQASADDRNPGYDPARALNGNSTLVSLIRADGITRALVYPSASRHPVFAGEPVIARYRDGANILGERDVAVFAVIGGGVWDKVGSRAQQWAVLRKVLGDAKRAADDRDTGEKDRRDRRGPPPGRGRRAGEEPVWGVIAGNTPLAIQTNRESDIREAIGLASDFGIRVVIVEGAQAWRVADELAAAKIPVVLDPSTNLPAGFDDLGSRQDNAAILARAGVTVAFGLAGGRIHMTYNAGLALREAAGIAVANGLPYIEALRGVTVNPQAIWSTGKTGGTLTAGTDADLVVWDGDPLEPSSNATHVIIEGRQASHRSRQDALAERYKDALR